MKNLKFVVLFMTIIMVLPMLGCPGGGNESSPVRIIVQAPCPPEDLELTVDPPKNNGKAGTYWDIKVSYTVKCAGKGIPAKLYIKLYGFPWKEIEAGSDGKGSATFMPSSDPTGDEITVEIYANDNADNPAQTETVTVPPPP